MVLKNLFDIHQILLKWIEEKPQDNTTEQELHLVYGDLLHQVIKFSHKLTSKESLHNYSEEQQDCIDKLEINLKSEEFCEKDVELFHFLFWMVAQQKGLYPAKSKVSNKMLAYKMNEIMSDPEKVESITQTSTLVKFLSSDHKSINSLGHKEKTTVLKVYGKKARVVLFDEFLSFVDGPGCKKRLRNSVKSNQSSS